MDYLYLSVALAATVLVVVVVRRWRRDLLSPPWRIHFLYHGFKARHRTFCPAILKEENDLKRLLYLLPYIAASFTPVILIVPRRTLLLASLAYIYWRILDTFDDLLVGEDREKGLPILRDRLQQLLQSGRADRNDAIDGFHFSIVGPRDEIYVSIVKSLDRLDSLFLQLEEAHRDVLLRFVEHQTKDFQSVPNSHFETKAQYREHCVITIMTGLYLATFEVNRTMYGHTMDESTKGLLEDTCISFETGNVIKDLEKDFQQGISYHPDLAPHGILEEIRSDEWKKLEHAREYLTYWGIQHLPSTCRMFREEWNEKLVTRAMALILKTYLVNQYRYTWSRFNGIDTRKRDTKRVFLGCLLKSFLRWDSAIRELDQEMLDWRPDGTPLWPDSD